MEGSCSTAPLLTAVLSRGRVWRKKQEKQGWVWLKRTGAAFAELRTCKACSIGAVLSSFRKAFGSIAIELGNGEERHEVLAGLHHRETTCDGFICCHLGA